MTERITLRRSIPCALLFNKCQISFLEKVRKSKHSQFFTDGPVVFTTNKMFTVRIRKLALLNSYVHHIPTHKNTQTNKTSRKTYRQTHIHTNTH